MSAFKPILCETVFDIFNDIMLKKSGGDLYLDPNFPSKMSNFMICRLLRMDNSLIGFADVANRNQSIWSKEEMYRFLYHNVPRTLSRCNYLKKKKVEEKKETKTPTKENGYLLI